MIQYFTLLLSLCLLLNVYKSFASSAPLLRKLQPGSDTDSHGCIPSAGYTWCEPLQECIRPWETDCDKYSTRDDTINFLKGIAMKIALQLLAVRADVTTTAERVKEVSADVTTTAVRVKEVTENVISQLKEVTENKYSTRDDTINFLKGIAMKIALQLLAVRADVTTTAERVKEVSADVTTTAVRVKEVTENVISQLKEVTEDVISQLKEVTENVISQQDVVFKAITAHILDAAVELVETHSDGENESIVSMVSELMTIAIGTDSDATDQVVDSISNVVGNIFNP